MRLEPLGARVIIKRDSSEEKSKGGIILPSAAKEKKTSGVILNVGGKCREELGYDLIKGDVVLFNEYAGDEVSIDGEKLLVVPAKDVMVRVKPKVKK